MDFKTNGFEEIKGLFTVDEMDKLENRITKFFISQAKKYPNIRKWL